MRFEAIYETTLESLLKEINRAKWSNHKLISIEATETVDRALGLNGSCWVAIFEKVVNDNS